MIVAPTTAIALAQLIKEAAPTLNSSQELAVMMLENIAKGDAICEIISREEWKERQHMKRRSTD